MAGEYDQRKEEEGQRSGIIPDSPHGL